MLFLPLGKYPFRCKAVGSFFTNKLEHMDTKKLLFTFFSVLCYSLSTACTFVPDSFCKTYQSTSDSPTFVGKIVSIDDFGIDLEIIEILRGEEINQTIRIWDGTDFDCNGNWSLAAAGIGQLNDTVILILDKIVELENEWDVIGDYRRRDPYSATTELSMSGEVVSGFLSGLTFAPPEFRILSLNYLDFIQQIIEMTTCPVITNIDEVINLEITKINNPFNTELRIQTKQIIQHGFIKLYNANGQMAYTLNVNQQNELEINTSHLPGGIYFLEIWADEKRLDVIKLVKM